MNPQSLTPISVRPPTQVPSKPKRGWWAKFRDAFHGLKFGIQGQASFFVHFFMAALVLAAATVLRCPLSDWIALLFCIGLVLTAELFNSALEALFHGLDERAKARAWRCLDIAAAAVLLSCITAVIVGSLVFLHRLGELLDW
jgi:diacylglycerol kinase